MSYVITGRCLGERYAECASFCSLNCIYPGQYQGEAFWVIDPEICNDCGACLPLCHLEAIVAAEESPEWATINEELAPLFKANRPLPNRPLKQVRQ